jgi:hypothetical protein
MSLIISLTPGFSPVTIGYGGQNRFNGFFSGDKPLKRLVCPNTYSIRLKPGVNETIAASHFHQAE